MLSTTEHRSLSSRSEKPLLPSPTQTQALPDLEKDGDILQYPRKAATSSPSSTHHKPNGHGRNSGSSNDNSDNNNDNSNPWPDLTPTQLDSATAKIEHRAVGGRSRNPFVALPSLSILPSSRRHHHHHHHHPSQSPSPSSSPSSSRKATSPSPPLVSRSRDRQRWEGGSATERPARVGVDTRVWSSDGEGEGEGEGSGGGAVVAAGGEDRGGVRVETRIARSTVEVDRDVDDGRKCLPRGGAGGGGGSGDGRLSAAS